MLNSPPYAQLDRDDTDSYGPETITINRTFNGTYRYFVYQWSSDGTLNSSGAEVNVFNQSSVIATYRVPTIGQGHYWQVFNLNSSTGAITSINTVGDGPQVAASGGSYTESATQSEKSRNTSDIQFICPPSGIAETRFTADRLATSSFSSYTWDFGDGSVSGEQNPVHTYMSAGLFPVTLNVTDSSGRHNSTQKAGYISADRPESSLSATSSQGIAPPGAILTFSGTNTYGTSPDVYTAVFVTNSTTGTGPLANGVRPDDFSVYTMTGNNATTNLAVVDGTHSWSYTWRTSTIAGGSLLPGSSYTFYFANQTLNRTTLPASGGWTRIAVGIEGPLHADYAVNTPSGTAPFSVTFTDISTGYPDQVNLSFGDGSWLNSTGSPPASFTGPIIHIYSTAGTYTPLIYVNNALSSDFRTNATISVSPGGTTPVVQFTASSTQGVPPLTVYFTDLSTVLNPVTWNWNFGDGTSFSTNDSLLRNPVHNYNLAGSYSVSLFITNASGTSIGMQPSLIRVSSVLNGGDGGTSGAGAGTSVSGGDTGGGIPAPAAPPASAAVPQNPGYGGTSHELPTEVTSIYHIGFTGLSFNADGNNALTLDLKGAKNAGANVTVLPDRIEIYQHNSPGILMTFWGDGFVTGNDTVSGTVSHAEFVTDPLNATFPIGDVSGSVHAALPHLTRAGLISSTLSSLPTEATTRRFGDIVAGSSMNLDTVAYTLTVRKENLTTGAADVTMTVPETWVNQHGGAESVRIPRISDNGSEELLSTTLTGTDTGGIMTFRGDSPNGTSLFGLVTAGVTAATQKEHPNVTYVPVSKPAMVTNMGMAGWLAGLVYDNPLLLLIGIVGVAGVAHFGWWKRRL
jgi:PKD repeat protein